MNIDNAVFTLDTKWVVSGDYTADVIRFGHHRFETPIFDTLAADRSARDITRFNLGDYR